jgi:uncharacterized protein (DUF1778 family)
VNKKRIQVFADLETKRRIELAAARRNVSVTQYCLEAIRQRLADDVMLARETGEIPTKQTKDEDLIADLRALRERILTRRDGKLISPDIVEQVREERERGLLGMR